MIANSDSLHERRPNTPTESRDDTRSLLRQVTRQAHMRLHAHPGLAALAQGQLSHDGYSQLLLDLLPLHVLVEQRLSAFADMPSFSWQGSFSQIQPSDRLRLDLLCLHASPIDVPDLGRLIPPFATQAAALGCAWVVEGSKLGALTLSRSLANSLEIGPDNGGAFFAMQPNQQARWLACCVAIEACGLTPDHRTMMVASAQFTFNVFLRWLSGAY